MAPGLTTAVPWTVQRARVTGGLMLAMFVAAMDSSVVSTAIPTIAGELGRFSLYPWLIAGYLLTSTTTVPLWGRLADIHGRRRVLMAGLAVFLVTSVLCAAAPDMAWLVAFRALQGIGAGCVLPVALTTVGDIFPVPQRARLQGLFSSVWAVAALAGPALGALFVTTIGWRWIFWINVPIVLTSVVMLRAHRDAPPSGERGRLDYAGAATLTVGIGLVLLGLDGGAGSTNLALVGLGLAALALFVLAQRRTDHPTIPFALLRHPVIGPATAAAFLAGMVMFALNAFLPLYVQGVLQRSSFEAGATVSIASLGWSGAAIFSGRALLRFGYQKLVVTGALSMVAGCALLVLNPSGAGVGWVVVAAFMIGAGMGQLQTPLLIVIQGAVDWRSRGAATALNQFSRTIGGAIGVSLLGALLSARVRATAPAHGVAASVVANPLSGGGHLNALTAPLVDEALRAVYAVLLLISLATLAIGFAILWSSRSRPTEPGETSAPAPDRGDPWSAR